MEENAQNNLVKDILEDARAEAEKLLRESEAWKTERIQAADKQVLQIRDEAKKTAAHQIAVIEKTMSSTLAVEKRRLSLRVRDEMLHEVIDAVEQRFEAMIEKPEYSDVLFGWIVEGALGLGNDSVVVNASKNELPKITEKLLADAAKKFEQLTGRKIKITLTTDQPLLAQGVFLSAQDNSLAFNNQIHTRLLRYQSEIRKMIFDRLFGEEKEAENDVAKEAMA
ncbi:MAG: hypothetical protein JW904_15745 [Spirochaetales bacterium]|nr:hypothetical protein [Spirochaetales bacterium]